jgi:hypothetical protein
MVQSTEEVTPSGFRREVKNPTETGMDFVILPKLHWEVTRLGASGR